MVSVAVGARARRDTVGDAFRRACRRDPRKVALTFESRSWTYADLDRAADRVAHRLRDAGLSSGDRIAAFGRNSDGYFILWLACVRGGFIHVPINYALTPKELAYIVEQSGARAIVHNAGLAGPAADVAKTYGLRLTGRFEGGGGLDIVQAALQGAEAPSDAPLLEPDLDERDLAQILYTSGTTALPKGAMMSHRGILSEYQSCIVALEFRPDDKALAALPLYHTAQMHAFTMPQMLAGASTLLIEAPVPERCLALVEEHGITSLFAPPTVWISLLRHPDFDRRNLSSLKNIYYGASIMPVPVLKELRRRLPGARPFNCYGQSEIGPLATVLPPEAHDARPASAGRPVLNVETRVVDAEMRDVAPGTQGEIIHRSSHLMLGYWNKAEETREAFAGDWFHSGDVGYLDEEGYLYVVDRLKDVIKTGGTIVASREVEEALFGHPAVSEVAVIALPDPKWIEAVTAIVVLRDGHSAEAGALIAHARGTLAPYKVPKRIIFRDNLPRNTAGKLLKRELRNEYAGG